MPCLVDARIFYLPFPPILVIYPPEVGGAERSPSSAGDCPVGMLQLDVESLHLHALGRSQLADGSADTACHGGRIGIDCLFSSPDAATGKSTQAQVVARGVTRQETKTVVQSAALAVNELDAILPWCQLQGHKTGGFTTDESQLLPQQQSVWCDTCVGNGGSPSNLRRRGDTRRDSGLRANPGGLLEQESAAVRKAVTFRKKLSAAGFLNQLRRAAVHLGRAAVHEVCSFVARCRRLRTQNFTMSSIFAQMHEDCERVLTSPAVAGQGGGIRGPGLTCSLFTRFAVASKTWFAELAGLRIQNDRRVAFLLMVLRKRCASRSSGAQPGAHHCGRVDVAVWQTQLHLGTTPAPVQTRHRVWPRARAPSESDALQNRVCSALAGLLYEQTSWRRMRRLWLQATRRICQWQSAKGSMVCAPLLPAPVPDENFAVARTLPSQTSCYGFRAASANEAKDHLTEPDRTSQERSPQATIQVELCVSRRRRGGYLCRNFAISDGLKGI